MSDPHIFSDQKHESSLQGYHATAVRGTSVWVHKQKSWVHIPFFASACSFVQRQLLLSQQYLGVSTKLFTQHRSRCDGNKCDEIWYDSMEKMEEKAEKNNEEHEMFLSKGVRQLRGEREQMLIWDGAQLVWIQDSSGGTLCPLPLYDF